MTLLFTGDEELLKSTTILIDQSNDAATWLNEAVKCETSIWKDDSSRAEAVNLLLFLILFYIGNVQFYLQTSNVPSVLTF